MPSFCCVPNWNQKGYTRSLGEKISLTFAKAPLMRKQWIHVIRQEEGKDFVITERVKVDSVHFRSARPWEVYQRSDLYQGRRCSLNLSGQDFLRKKKGPDRMATAACEEKTARRRQLSSVCICKK